VLGRVGEAPLGAIVRYICGAITLNGSVAAIEEATKRISDLVGAVKTFSHLDRSPVGEVNVKEGIESTKLMLLHKLKRHKLEKDISPDLPPLWGYAGELNQVWTNLLDNAADAVEGMPDGCIKIRAYIENDCVAVDIEDNGPGIPPEVQRRLFEPFYTTKGVGKGTGLGLATAYGIVHGHHGGEIVVNSVPGRTVFHVCLPLDSIEAVRQQKLETAAR
jgi:signal transduction histidine kinase